VTCFASVVNVVLLSQVNLPGQFLFSLIFFYCGIELMILYYVFQFLHTEPSSEEDISLTLSEE
jgi:fucose permease